MRATYASAARAAAQALEQPTPRGGTFLFFDLQPFMKRSDDASDVLDRCAQAGVLLTPGSACGADFTTWARLCFTTVPEPELHEALRRLRTVLFANP
jgi:DNA-binding transcriptional MocR family regulator